MACEECSELTTHQFRSPEDLINALQVAAAEMDRGVLKQLQERTRTSAAEQEALDSAFFAGALPGAVSYRFTCAVCGDRFLLTADTSDGGGAWVRNDEQLPTS